MIKVRKGLIPKGSLVEGYLPADYSDVFECTVLNGKPFTPDDLQVNFWTVQPKWLEILFKIRNILVKPFGLSDGKGNNEEFENCIRSGGKLGMVTVPPKTPEETILELRDKHLDAILSVYIKEASNGTDVTRTVITSTLVHFHNKLGVTYFFFIRPFHKIIVKSMVGTCVKAMSFE